MGTKVNNFDIKSTHYTAVGVLHEIGSYSGEYQAEAYDILDIDGELEEDEWCDICENAKGEIYAVFGDTSGDQTGNFYFKCVSDGITADASVIEMIGKCVAKYCVYRPNTKTVDYSIEYFNVNGSLYVYNHREGDEAYLSSYDELEEARESDILSDGYWAI